jgi:hypothetical protein
MSATNRGGIREDKDQYATPERCVTALLNKVFLPTDGLWLEPCAGAGGIIKAVNAHPFNRPHEGWDAVELDNKYVDKLIEIPNTGFVECPRDFLTWTPPAIIGTTGKYSAIITNPPYTLAFDFIEKSLQLSDVVVMLLRLNFLGTVERYHLSKYLKPDVHVLVPRPSFTNNSTDSCEYGWFVYAPWSSGKWEMLDLMPTKKKPRESILWTKQSTN